MNQKFFASLTGKYLRTLALLFVLFGAAQQLSAQSLVAPTVALGRLKEQALNVQNQTIRTKGETQAGLLRLRLEYYAIVSNGLSGGGVTTQQVLDKGALLLTEQFSKLPGTNVTLTSGHVQTVLSETTDLLLN